MSSCRRRRTAYFYVIDATTGKVISAKNYVPTVNYKPLDLKTGTLSFKDELRWWNYPGKPIVLQPGGYGAHTWELTSYSPKTGFVYIPAHIMPYELGGRYAEYGFAEDAVFKNKGLLIAWDPLAQEKRWEVEHPVTMNGGVLSTAGNIVFQGTPSGTFDAYEAKTGKKLWSYDTRSVIHGGPSTVMVGGKADNTRPIRRWNSDRRCERQTWEDARNLCGAIAASSVLVGRKDGVASDTKGGSEARSRSPACRTRGKRQGIL